MGILGRPNIKKLQAQGDVEGLAKALSHSEWWMRLDAARALGELGDPRAAAFFMVNLRDQSAPVRANAARVLGKLGDSQAIVPLTAVLKDADADVRKCAIEALEKLGHTGPLTEIPTSPIDDTVPSEPFSLPTARRRMPKVVARSRHPAGFWIRVAAYLIDGLVLSPLTVASFIAFFSAKSLPLVLLLSIPGMVYKPLMESRYGATLGKMACGLRVIDEHGEWLSIAAAYVRFSPQLARVVVGLIGTVWLFSVPQFQTISDFGELAQLMLQGPFYPVYLLNTVLEWVFLIDCVTAAFTDRKRAIHDMLAGSYCVRKVA